MDELGRGTSTYDGFAIAYSVLKYLSDNIKVIWYSLILTHQVSYSIFHSLSFTTRGI